MKPSILCSLGFFLLTSCAPVGRIPSSSLTSSSRQSVEEPPAQPLPAPISTAAPTPPTLPTPPRPSSAKNLRTCPTGKATDGIDVSTYDANTNWPTVQQKGRAFAFVKASEGLTVTNRYFPIDWMSTKALGLLRGAYHFFHPSDDPHKQAQLFLRQMGPLEANDFPAVLDWEVSDGVSAPEQIASAQIWLHEVEIATAKVPILYTGPVFWNELGNPQGFERFPLFIANYDEACPYIPPPWSQWTFWQSGTYPLAGVMADKVDYDVFNGSLEELTKFASVPFD